MPTTKKAKMNIGERMVKLEEKLDSHCLENNEHFVRIEKGQDDISLKLDQNLSKMYDKIECKADKKDLEQKANTTEVKAVSESVKELRNWVIGGILISIFLMLLAITIKK